MIIKLSNLSCAKHHAEYEVWQPNKIQSNDIKFDLKNIWKATLFLF